MFDSLTVILCACTLFVEQISCSAIPMWELLNRDEKTSYLYATFTKQVEEYCEFSELENCNLELLKYGRLKLKAMPEERLDEMDPYQRGASTLIWDTVMDGHPVMKNVRKTTTLPPAGSYDDDTSFSANDLNDFVQSQPDNVYRVPPPSGFVYIPSKHNYASGIPEYKLPPTNHKNSPSSKNSIFSDEKPHFNLHSTYEPAVDYVRQEGPMVVRVYPDGTPVRESTLVIPRDEDYRQYKLTQIRLPRRYL